MMLLMINMKVFLIGGPVNNLVKVLITPIYRSDSIKSQWNTMISTLKNNLSKTFFEVI